VIRRYLVGHPYPFGIAHLLFYFLILVETFDEVEDLGKLHSLSSSLKLLKKFLPADTAVGFSYFDCYIHPSLISLS
jgi:hypothetical protein